MFVLLATILFRRSERKRCRSTCLVSLYILAVLGMAISCSPGRSSSSSRCESLRKADSGRGTDIDMRAVVASSLQRYKDLTAYKASVSAFHITLTSGSALLLLRSSSYENRAQFLKLDYAGKGRIEWTMPAIERIFCSDSVLNEKPCRQQIEDLMTRPRLESIGEFGETTSSTGKASSGVIEWEPNGVAVTTSSLEKASMRYSSVFDAMDWLESSTRAQSPISRLVIKSDDALLDRIDIASTRLVGEENRDGNACFVVSAEIDGPRIGEEPPLTVQLWIRKSDNLIQRLELIECTPNVALVWIEEHHNIRSSY